MVHRLDLRSGASRLHYGRTNTFLQVADYYLVSYALAHGHIVVTHEVPVDTVRKIKIPNVCVGIGIICITPYAMLWREGAKFVLGSD